MPVGKIRPNETIWIMMCTHNVESCLLRQISAFSLTWKALQWVQRIWPHHLVFRLNDVHALQQFLPTKRITAAQNILPEAEPMSSIDKEKLPGP